MRRAVGRAVTRAAGFSLLDGLILAVGAGLAGAWLAGLTLRGDIASPVVTGICLVAILGWPVVQTIRAVRRWGRGLAGARAIAQMRGPLSESRTTASDRADRLLRHEVLGAAELAGSIERGEPARSLGLVEGYLADVARRIESPRIRASLALPRPRTWPRSLAAGLVAFAVLTSIWIATPMGGLTLMLEGTDGRPPTPPEPVWSTLTLELEYPEYTRRPIRSVPNPSGALRLVAGTRVQLDLRARRAAQGASVVISYDPADYDDPPPPERITLEAVAGAEPDDGMSWQGAFVARGSGTWTVALLDDEDDDLSESTRRSAAMPLQLEADRPPEIELLPLPNAQREVSERDDLDLRFVARDDFGLASARLVYQMPDGESHHIPIGAPDGAPRTWRGRHTWDLSAIPISERSELLYWIEVRDNDPGLGIVPLDDGPGKVTRSATMRLVVEDDEAEHAQNIANLAKIRDTAVDLLAARMLTPAFDTAAPDETLPPPTLGARMRAARGLLSGSSTLLTMLAQAIDAAALDTLTQERDVAVLTAVHERLMELHRAELKLHEGLVAGIERTDPEKTEKGLSKLEPHNTEETTQLEDEIIRLDDLVDGQIIERLEALVARLEATQRKLVELLEQLKAGDESVRPQIDQLEQRRREDLRRIAETRSMLREEVDEEFMNLDAFKVLQEMQEREKLSEMLQRDELDEALEQAKSQLGDVQGLRDAVQQRAGSAQQAPEALSEEDRKRMELLRELSRLQDEEGNIRAQTKGLEKEWRSAVAGRDADPDDTKDAARRAKELAESLDEINDARLGREGRRGLEDAKAELDKLAKQAESEEGAKALDLADAARKIAEGLQRAADGSEAKEREGKALRKAAGAAQKLAQKTRGALPSPGKVLENEAGERFEELTRRQAGLRKRADELLESDSASELPRPGRKALQNASSQMDGSEDELGREDPQDAGRRQSQAWDAIQKAIDSLRQSSPPPPSAANSADASTEAERDRSLRDALMEAMREGSPDGYDSPVKRYYEELLR